jgi:hypothetical protein
MGDRTMAAITDKALVTVKAINAKLAKQIEVLNYDWRENGKYREVWAELMPRGEAGEPSHKARVLGWASWEAVMGPSTTMRRARFWLVRYAGQLWWWAAPGETDEGDSGLLHKYYNPGLEQLFLG